MKELSVFIDESGDFGEYNKISPYYIVTISDFRYSVDRNGNEYGWGIAEYSLPEKFFGKRFTDAVYRHSPQESYARVVKQLKKILPDAVQEQIEKILR